MKVICVTRRWYLNGELTTGPEYGETYTVVSAEDLAWPVYTLAEFPGEYFHQGGFRPISDDTVIIDHTIKEKIPERELVPA